MAEFVSGYIIYSLIIVAIILVVGGLIYLILRPLVLWYFKIYTVVSELKENNELLREIRDELKKKNNQAPVYQQPKEDYTRFMPK